MATNAKSKAWGSAERMRTPQEASGRLETPKKGALWTSSDELNVVYTFCPMS